MSENHLCEDFSVQAHDKPETVCIKCGRVLESICDTEVSDDEGQMMNGHDHYSGNTLLNSQTQQAGYVNFDNPGVAFALSGTKARDYTGKRIRRQLRDGYKAGNVVDKGMVMREDRLTGESELKFSWYETPYIQLLKQKADQELSRFGLTSVDMSIIAIFLKQMCSRLAGGPIVEFCWMAAALNSGVLKADQAAEIEKRMYDTIGEIRYKLLARCDPALVKKIREEEKPKQEIKAS
jgi:hypothetical protein